MKDIGPKFYAIPSPPQYMTLVSKSRTWNFYINVLHLSFYNVSFCKAFDGFDSCMGWINIRLPRKIWLRPDMTEKLLTGTLSLNTNKQNKILKWKGKALFQVSCPVWQQVLLPQNSPNFPETCNSKLVLFESRHENTCFCHMRTTKTQISLRNRAVWSALLLFAV